MFEESAFLQAAAGLDHRHALGALVRSCGVMAASVAANAACGHWAKVASWRRGCRRRTGRPARPRPRTGPRACRRSDRNPGTPGMETHPPRPNRGRRTEPLLSLTHRRQPAGEGGFAVVSCGTRRDGSGDRVIAVGRACGQGLLATRVAKLTEIQEALLPRWYVLAPVEFNSVAPTCDCAAHRATARCCTRSGVSWTTGSGGGLCPGAFRRGTVCMRSSADGSTARGARQRPPGRTGHRRGTRRAVSHRRVPVRCAQDGTEPGHPCTCGCRGRHDPPDGAAAAQLLLDTVGRDSDGTRKRRPAIRPDR